MNFYNDAKNVEKYIEMCSDYDGSNLYQILDRNLENGSTLLELGSGPGNDIAYLMNKYSVTGSDLSDEFIFHCRNRFPDVLFLNLDALSLDIDENFDCIYSNKVLHHLAESELINSLDKQIRILSPDGLVAHSFWIGEESHEMKSLLFTYYKEERLIEIFSEHFRILAAHRYQEFEESDSLFLIARLNR